MFIVYVHYLEYTIVVQLLIRVILPTTARLDQKGIWNRVTQKQTAPIIDIMYWSPYEMFSFLNH